MPRLAQTNSQECAPFFYGTTEPTLAASSGRVAPPFRLLLTAEEEVHMSRGNIVANNHITYYGSIFGGVSGFHSSRGRVEDLVQNNRFEGNSITVVQRSATPAGSNPTKCFRFGSEYLELEQAQQRGQETHSHLEIDPSGTSANLAVKCPPAVVDRGAPR